MNQLFQLYGWVVLSGVGLLAYATTTNKSLFLIGYSIGYTLAAIVLSVFAVILLSKGKTK